MNLTSFHSIEEGLKSGIGEGVLYVEKKRASDKRFQNIITSARNQGVRVEYVGSGKLDRFAGGEKHQGAVLSVGENSGQAADKSDRRNGKSPGGESLPVDLEEYLGSLPEDPGEGRPNIVLLLDGITDPQNIGAILRSADQFGVDLVLIPGRRSGKVDATVMRVSTGAAAYVPVAYVVNLVRAARSLKDAGFWIYGASAEGSAAGTTAFSRRTALVLGSEGEGMSRLMSENCDEHISIPTQGHVDSLNVSVAGGILLYKIREVLGNV
ncbi:MAG: 23S rRNA (guanosine(2251)-2'-O)-methyltransferase RlmB [Spirochaetales bacterium]|nr:23S rRNA (guanosine(2251)-2'-O)-methyltransferase RlmB [Spirochaetales bacterium]MCF7938636.1 23S rRNA (guanosine(2251)-2'-O)-methyltransferase RlmB [Spirochaetales bacterium]